MSLEGTRGTVHQTDLKVFPTLRKLSCMVSVETEAHGLPLLGTHCQGTSFSPPCPLFKNILSNSPYVHFTEEETEAQSKLKTVFNCWKR